MNVSNFLNKIEKKNNDYPITKQFIAEGKGQNGDPKG